jgi:hypothetical protein
MVPNLTRAMAFKKILFVAVLSLIGMHAISQSVPEHISNRGIYDFLDEMASEQLIELNSTVKPYNRSMILNKLQIVKGQKANLNTRQRKELAFYLKDYRLTDSTSNQPLNGTSSLDIFPGNNRFSTGINPVGLFYKDQTFAFAFRPIWGIEYMSNNNDAFSRTWGFGRIYGQVGEHFSFYANLRDNHMTHVLARPVHFTRREGGVYKANDLGGGDYSEMRGGITYGWDWGEVSLMKDHLEWGDNYNGSIINSGRYPSYGMIKLHLKPARWFEFNYYHGWLVSEVIDSTRSYQPKFGYYRAVFKPKYIASNMFTIYPIKRIGLSFGNSIVYSDLYIQAAYLIPFMFYKSIDHTINANVENQNSQMFANISIRSIKHFHFYGSIFIDEFSIDRINNPKEHNFYSWKTGIKISNWPIRNISLNYEATKTLPITYTHYIPVVTYATNHYNLGHYLKDNSLEHYMNISLFPFKNFSVTFSYVYAKHGISHQYKNSIPFISDKHPFIVNKTWDKTAISFKASYEFSANSYIFAGYTYRNIQGYSADGQPAEYYLSKYTPGMFHGETQTLRFGFNIGF